MCKLGKSFGREDNEIRSSTIAIQNIEVDRLVLSSKNKLENKNNIKTSSSSRITYYSDEEGKERFDAILGRLCGDLNEESHEKGYDHVLCDLNDVPRKNKSLSTTKIKTGKPKKTHYPIKIVSPMKGVF
jgi:hypothetical protein